MTTIQQMLLGPNKYYSPYMDQVGDLYDFSTFTFTPMGATGRFGPVSSSSATTITNSLLGSAALTSSTTPTNGGSDDGFWSIPLPWDIVYNGIPYSTVYIGTNSYITFDSGQTVFSGLSASTPNVNKIMIQAADNSAQRIYYGTEGSFPNRTYRIRYEGTSATSGLLGSPNMVWEVVFYENNKSQIDIQIGAMGRTGGVNGAYTSTNLITTGNIGNANTGTRLSSLLTGTIASQVWYPTYYSLSSGIQYWYAPTTGSYTIRAAGAAGHDGFYANTCRGIIIESTLTLTKGMLYKIMVGQKGINYPGGSGGGGGGTFLTEVYNTPVIVAGGGGGCIYTTGTTRIVNGVDDSVAPNSDGQSGTSGGNNTYSSPAAGGSDGRGGSGGFNQSWGSGGGGLFGNGTAATQASGYGYSGLGFSFINGGTGGDTATSAVGGFGGGAGTHGNTGGGGGGGGYSGGAGSGYSVVIGSDSNFRTWGGGGGSYSQSAINVIGYNTGHGYLTITKN